MNGQWTLTCIAAAALLAGCNDRTAPLPTCAFDYEQIKADEMRDIDKGMVVLGRLARQEAQLDTLYAHERTDLERAQAILASRDRPVDALDVALLDDALARLTTVDEWDRNDDRDCTNDDGVVSLYCALYFASLDYLGGYEHRRTALQEVRFAIDDASADQNFEHRLMDFNNLPATSLDDVRGVLLVARDRIAARLAGQAECANEH